MATRDELISAARKADEAGDAPAAKRFLELAKQAGAGNASPAAIETEAPAASMLDSAMSAGSQFMSGANEGIANLLGAPVDLMTGAMNLGIKGVNAAAGTEIPTITDPIGGSGSLNAVMDPFISDAQPANAPERYLRSIGRDVGASAIPVGAGLGVAQKIGPSVVAALQSSVGSGIASQAARDVAPDSPVVEILAGLAGGAAPLALHRPQRVAAPTTEQLNSRAGDLYEAGRSRAPAAPGEVDNLNTSIVDVLKANNRVTPAGRVMADGNIKNFLGVMEDYKGQPMTPGDMQSLRTYLQDAAASADAGERRMGAVLLGSFDDWRNKQVPDFAEADALYARAKRAEDVDWRVAKADLRAASTGTGGNSVNAARQNIRQILDSPKARRGYSEAELAAMNEIVRGTPTVNAARLLGRLSPTSGALPLMGALAGVGISPHIAIPAMGVASGAKGLSEIMTNRQISALSEMIRNGGPLPKATSTEAQSAIVRALLGQTLSGGAGGLQ